MINPRKILLNLGREQTEGVRRHRPPEVARLKVTTRVDRRQFSRSVCPNEDADYIDRLHNHLCELLKSLSWH
jgi:ribosomal protein L34E